MASGGFGGPTLGAATAELGVLFRERRTAALEVPISRGNRPRRRSVEQIVIRAAATLLVAGAVLVASGCGGGQDAGVRASDTATTAEAEVNLCERTRSPEAVVIAVYEATVGQVRSWADRSDPKAGLSRWPGRPEDERVELCWYDGPVGKSPPALAGATAPTPFDRYATIVSRDLQVDWVIAGYRERLQPEPPAG